MLCDVTYVIVYPSAPLLLALYAVTLDTRASILLKQKFLFVCYYGKSPPTLVGLMNRDKSVISECHIK